MASTCPPEHELAELADGRAGDAASRLREHIDDCDDCRVALAHLLTHRRPATNDPGPVAGRYRCLRRIGRGGMGEVHEAWDLNLERRVALKTLIAHGIDHDGDDAERRIARLVRESKAMARLRHPNVVAVHDAGVWQGQAFVVMELVDGQTLRAWMQPLGPAPRSFAEIVAMFVAAGRGLQVAHEHGIVHRDFKPDNVLVDEHGRAQVTDFGLARWSEDGRGPATMETPIAAAWGAGADAEPVDLDMSGSLTETGVAVGTPAYMAPEQFRGHEVDARADVFAFCVSLFEALCGRRPFLGSSPREILDAQRRGASDDVLRARGVPRWLRDAVTSGLAFDPAARPRDVATLLRRLQPVASRSRWLVRTAVVAAVGLGASGMMLAGGRSDDPCAEHDPLAQIWNDETRAAIDGAEPAWARPPLDRWAQTWGAAWKQACTAAPEDRDAGLRRACLLGQRGAFAAVVDRLRGREIDAGAAQRGLPRIRDCGGDRDLALLRPEPDDPDAAMRVEQVRAELDELLGLQNAGHFRDLDGRCTSAVVRARAIGFRPLEAEAVYIAGTQHVVSGRPLDGRTTLVDAAQIAIGSGHDAAAATAWIALVELEADELHEFERADEYADNARAAIERLGASAAVHELRMSLHFAFGKLLWQQGNTAAAKLEFRAGEELARRLDQPEQRYGMLEGLAVVLEDEGRIDEAIAVHLELAEHRRTELGEDHPQLVISYANLASAYSVLGQYDTALEYAERSTGVAERAQGELHPDHAMALHNEGEILRELGRYDEALVRLRRAQAVFEASAGPESYRVASSLMHEAGALQGLRRYGDAVSLMRRALEIFDRQQAPRDAANARMNLADVLRESGHAEDALPYARAAAELLERDAAQSPEAAYALSVLGEVQLALGQPADAITALERALDGYTAGEFLPHQAAVAQYLLARALDARADDRERATALLDGAEATLRDAPPSWELRRRELAAYRLTRAMRIPP